MDHPSDFQTESHDLETNFVHPNNPGDCDETVQSFFVLLAPSAIFKLDLEKKHKLLKWFFM